MWKGREDDNIETIRKRFKVFMDSSLPVIQYYESKGKVRKVNILSHFVYISNLKLFPCLLYFPGLSISEMISYLSFLISD